MNSCRQLVYYPPYYQKENLIHDVILITIADMKYILIVFTIIAASLSLIGAFGQLFVKERKAINYFLFTQLFCLAILQTQAFGFMSEAIFTYPALFFFHATSLYLTGAIRYFSHSIVSLKMTAISGKKLLFFIPSCIAALFDLYFLVLPDADKAALLTSLFSGSMAGWTIFLKLLLAGAALQNTVLWGIIIAKLIRRKTAGKEVILFGNALIYNVLAIAAINILVAGYLIPMPKLFIVASVMLSLMVIGTFLMFMMNPEFLEIIALPKSKKRYLRSRLVGIETHDLYRRVMELIEKEKIYADENVSLTDCADELSITPHQLSEFLNERMNSNFYTFINQHRIKEAVRLLEEEPQQTILSIANMVGFNSKSSFYDSFSRFMGMTPNRYRSKFLKKKDR